MLQDTAFSGQQQQEAPARSSASEQPEALAQAIPKSKLSTTSSASSTPPNLTPTQQQALSAIDARLHLLGDYAVEAFKCQLWEPSRAVKDLEPGDFPYQALCPFCWCLFCWCPFCVKHMPRYICWFQLMRYLPSSLHLICLLYFLLQCLLCESTVLHAYHHIVAFICHCFKACLA